MDLGLVDPMEQVQRQNQCKRFFEGLKPLEASVLAPDITLVRQPLLTSFAW